MVPRRSVSSAALAAAVLAAAPQGLASAPSPLPLPLLGWSSWDTFGCHINETVVRGSIEALAASPLFAAGYRWIFIDDGWTKCTRFRPGPDGACAEPGPRDAEGRIVVDEEKFPSGFRPLTAYAANKGIKLGIYTSVSAVTCGGFTGSLHNEAIDAKTFADWGFDFVKHDTCGTDYSIHDGGLQNASRRMREGLFAAGGGRMIYYLDHGNPTSPQRVFNPYQRGITDQEALHKLAVRPEELAWVWVHEMTAHDELGPHMLKSWFDVADAWGSTLTNLHNQVRVAEYQRCGMFHMPDYLTVGMGAQSYTQYQAQFFLWAILGAPLVLGNDIRNMDAQVIALVTAPEVLAIDQDPDCVQGSMARSVGAVETWIKPLRDGSFAVVLLNKGETPANITVSMNGNYAGGWHDGQDFFPASFERMFVRDVFAKADLGWQVDRFTAEAPATGARIFTMRPAPPTDVVSIV